MLAAVAGDFNLPDIDWDILNTKSGGVVPVLSKQLIDITNDFGLEQVVREPTRINNILYLCFTSNPTLVERSSVVPGICDHDGIPIVIISCKPRIIKQIPRKIYMYHTTDLQALKIDLIKWSDEFKLRDTVQGSNLSRSRRPGASKNKVRDSRIYCPLARAGTWKYPV